MYKNCTASSMPIKYVYSFQILKDKNHIMTKMFESQLGFFFFKVTDLSLTSSTNFLTYSDISNTVCLLKIYDFINNMEQKLYFGQTINIALSVFSKKKFNQ